MLRRSCESCGGCLLLLRGEEGVRRVCASCSEAESCARERRAKARRRLEATLKDESSHSTRNERNRKSVKRGVQRHSMRDSLVRVLRPRSPEPKRVARPPKRPTHCDCGRSLNLGRHKTEGDTCGTCKRENARARRVHRPMYCSFEELERQLEDHSPLPEDGDDE